MSFSFEFYAKPSDVSGLLNNDSSAKIAPECVKEFIQQAITNLPADLVHIKANGHLFKSDYQISNCNISVTPIMIKTAPVPQP